MRIVHAVRSDGFAGVERHLCDLSAAQAASGHQVTVIGGSATSMPSALDPAVPFRRATTTVDVVRALRRLRGRVDVVHAHMTAAELAAAVATPAATPLVVTRHFAGRRGRSVFGRPAAALIRRRVDAQIAISRYVAGVIDEPTTVIYPGIAPDTAPPAARRPVALVVQRLEKEKATDIALRAFAAGAPAGWSLEVAGRGSELSALQTLASELGISARVSFLGFREDVPELMRTTSLLLAPCEVEGLGLTVLEAMAHGLPVIASRAGAHPETVGRAQRAQLFEAGNWAQAGVMLAGLAADPRSREEYGAQLADVQRSTFTPASQVRAIDAVYQTVLR